MTASFCTFPWLPNGKVNALYSKTNTQRAKSGNVQFVTPANCPIFGIISQTHGILPSGQK